MKNIEKNLSANFIVFITCFSGAFTLALVT